MHLIQENNVKVLKYVGFFVFELDFKRIFTYENVRVSNDIKESKS